MFKSRWLCPVLQLLLALPCVPAGIVCSENCKCLDCKNYEGSEARDALVSPQVGHWAGKGGQGATRGMRPRWLRRGWLFLGCGCLQQAPRFSTHCLCLPPGVAGQTLRLAALPPTPAACALLPAVCPDLPLPRRLSGTRAGLPWVCAAPPGAPPRPRQQPRWERHGQVGTGHALSGRECVRHISLLAPACPASRAGVVPVQLCSGSVLGLFLGRTAAAVGCQCSSPACTWPVCRCNAVQACPPRATQPAARSCSSSSSSSSCSCSSRPCRRCQRSSQ